MFNLSTEYGNTLDLADCVLNSLEIDFHDMPPEYITTAAVVILHVMDEYSKLAEKLIAA